MKLNKICSKVASNFFKLGDKIQYVYPTGEVTSSTYEIIDILKNGGLIKISDVDGHEDYPPYLANRFKKLVH